MIYLSWWPATVTTPVSPAAVDYTPAFIGLVGVLIGGTLQTVTQRWAIKHDRMMDIRGLVSKFAASISSYTSVLVQSAMAIDSARDDFAERSKTDPKGEVDIDEDYIQRLGKGLFNTYDDAMRLSVQLMNCSDYRVADQAGNMHLTLTNIQNEVGEMYSGSTHIPDERARGLQQELNEEASVLLHMVTARQLERHSQFRSREKAAKALAKSRELRT